MILFQAFLVAQMVKNPPATQETCIQSLGWEDPLEKAMASHYSILAWRIPWTVKSMSCMNWTQRATFTPHTQSIIYALYIM